MGEGSDVEEDLTCSPDKKGCLSPALFSLVCDKVSFSLESIRKTYYKPAKLILTGLQGQRVQSSPQRKISFNAPSSQISWNCPSPDYSEEPNSGPSYSVKRKRVPCAPRTFRLPLWITSSLKRAFAFLAQIKCASNLSSTESGIRYHTSPVLSC